MLLSIRAATARDLPAIVRIYNESIPGRMATADLTPVTVKSRRSWFAGHRGKKMPLWVAVSRGRVVGWLSFQFFYGRAAYRRTVEVSVYVAKTAQGRGVGAQLLAASISGAPALGIKTILAFVFEHNAPSLGLFKKFGFKRWGLLPKVAELDGAERGLAILGAKFGSRAGP